MTAPGLFRPSCPRNCRAARRCRCPNDLLIIEKIGADAGEPAKQWQMLRGGNVEVKLASGLVARRVVFGVNVEPGETGQFEAVCRPQIPGVEPWLEGPVVLSRISQLACSKTAGR